MLIKLPPLRDSTEVIKVSKYGEYLVWPSKRQTMDRLNGWGCNDILWKWQDHEKKNVGSLSKLRKTFSQLPTRKQEAHLYSHKKLSLDVHLNSLGSQPLTATTKSLYHRTYTIHLWWFFYISKLANKNKHIYLLCVCFSISKQNHILTPYIHLFYTWNFNQSWTKAIFK